VQTTDSAKYNSVMNASALAVRVSSGPAGSGSMSCWNSAGVTGSGRIRRPASVAAIVGVRKPSSSTTGSTIAATAGALSPPDVPSMPPAAIHARVDKPFG